MDPPQQPPQPPNPAPPAATTDPFDDLLTLEDTLYTTAYASGARDGARAGRIEGRIFGLEKGFDKFSQLGQLHGRACIWGARIDAPAAADAEPQDVEHEQEHEQPLLPRLPRNSRLEKHVSMLHALTDPLTFSTDNAEEAVADFDDRFRRAGAKAKIIERLVGEEVSAGPSSPAAAEEGKSGKVKVKGEAKKSADFEDFAGSSVLS
ncbi:hypothetical protein EJ04DRAFT_544660 [Polyplosphaeria fusca]|uniref:Essential protein Yae1 N-terminal domain-containing protein n=1 Tax=Polyplosphaeria fusca TaxID=682080 RepID=A0A9P4UXS6_9PLEO|nr:hypothetical protein EJ04DRAFT_544660 [Polyplosphaeria fusca]